MDAETLTLPSAIHGERRWRRVGELEVKRRKGKRFVWGRWQSACVICGATFEIRIPGSVRSIDQSKAFATVTCALHRMTPAEVGQLRVAKPDQRRPVFETIKMRKLGRLARERAERGRDVSLDTLSRGATP
jgi:hypothetical protein